jgi:hypothetical protein
MLAINMLLPIFHNRKKEIQLRITAFQLRCPLLELLFTVIFLNSRKKFSSNVHKYFKNGFIDYHLQFTIKNRTPWHKVIFFNFPCINQVRRFGCRLCFHLQARKAPNIVYPLDRPSLESTM